MWVHLAPSGILRSRFRALGRTSASAAVPSWTSSKTLLGPRRRLLLLRPSSPRIRHLSAPEETQRSDGHYVCVCVCVSVCVCVCVCFYKTLEAAAARRCAIYEGSWPPEPLDLDFRRVGRCPIHIEEPPDSH